jgi:hypothetical protein
MIETGKFPRFFLTPYSAPTQEGSMRALAIECLVTVLQSLVDWSKELADPNKTNMSTLTEETNTHTEERECLTRRRSAAREGRQF